MLDSDPDRDRIHAAAVAGTLPTTTMDEILRRQQERQSPASDDEADLWPVLGIGRV
jgi:hypothetical protein